MLRSNQVEMTCAPVAVPPAGHSGARSGAPAMAGTLQCATQDWFGEGA